MPGKAAADFAKKGGKRRIFPGKTEKRKQVRIIEKEDIKSWNQEELGGFLVSLGEKPFRAKQIYPWLHVKHARTFEEMTDISKQLKHKLSKVCELTALQKVQVQCSKLDGTRKYLFALSDGNMIEIPSL